MQNCVISTGITSLYGTQRSSAVFAWKATTFGPELQVSMGPRPHMLFCACKTARFAPKLQVSVGPRPHLSLFAYQTACLASELLVPLGASHHPLFLHAKQRLLVQNYKSLWFPDLTCRFVHAKRRD